MPLNVRRVGSSIFLGLFSFTTVIYSQATQAVNQPSPVPAAAAPIKTLTAAEVMRDRISKAKAFIAVRNYNAAIYELEMIRRETSDSSVLAVTNILLMNSYLEQGNYKKAQDFLNEFYKNFKANNANGSMFYSAVAAQVVKGARNQIERYRSLGLVVSDRNLPLEAVNDIEKMRETLELVITQTKEAGSDKVKAAVAIPLLEEALAARGSLGRDDYDAKRWREEGADARESLAVSRSIVINAIDGTPAMTAAPQVTPPQQQTNTQTGTADLAANASKKVADNTIAANTTAPAGQPQQTNSTSNTVTPVEQPQMQPVVEKNSKGPNDKLTAAVINKPVESTARMQPEKSAADDRSARVVKTVSQTPVQQAENNGAPNTAASAKTEGPVDVGSLLAYATEKTAPSYPAAARTMRASGIVKVEVVVDENGEVAEVKKAEGPALLQAAAKEAIRKWKFRPIVREGQAVRVSGYVSFNFSL